MLGLCSSLYFIKHIESDMQVMIPTLLWERESWFVCASDQALNSHMHHWVWEVGWSPLGAVNPQMGSHTEDHPMLDWATWGICLPMRAMHLILSSSLHSLTTGRTIWAVQLQMTSNAWAKQSPFSKATKCILNYHDELQASSAFTFIGTPRSMRSSHCLSSWVRKRQLTWRPFFLFLCS